MLERKETSVWVEKKNSCYGIPLLASGVGGMADVEATERRLSGVSWVRKAGAVEEPLRAVLALALLWFGGETSRRESPRRAVGGGGRGGGRLVEAEVGEIVEGEEVVVVLGAATAEVLLPPVPCGWQ